MKLIKALGTLAVNSEGVQLQVEEYVQFIVKVLEDDVMRVAFKKNGQWQLPRTLMVDPVTPLSAVSLPSCEQVCEGRHRDDCSVFSMPKFDAEVQKDERSGAAAKVVITAALLRLTIIGDPFRCRWEWRRKCKVVSSMPSIKQNQRGHEKNGDYDDGDGGNDDWQPLLQDRDTGAYYFARQGEGHQFSHYLKRCSGDQFFGLGEVTGNVNKAGTRRQLAPIDAMGYNAERTNPIYKHFPLYIKRPMVPPSPSSTTTTTTIPSSSSLPPPRSVVVATAAVGLFYDNAAHCTFDFGQELDNYHDLYHYYIAEDGDLDLYVVLGPTVLEVTKRFNWLTGRTLFCPRYSLGYCGSGMGYTEAPDASIELAKFITRCQDSARSKGNENGDGDGGDEGGGGGIGCASEGVRDLMQKGDAEVEKEKSKTEHEEGGRFGIPCNTFKLSSGWCTAEEDKPGYAIKRHTFVWNKKKIPDPEALIKTFEAAGIHVSANIKPFILTTHPHYTKLADEGLFIRDVDHPTRPQIETVGLFGGLCSYLDFCHPRARQYWMDMVTSSLLNYGLSAWNDNNEFQVDGEALCTCLTTPAHGDWHSEQQTEKKAVEVIDDKAAMERTAIRASLIRPLLSLLMMQTSFAAHLRHNPHKRPWLLSRCGCPGMQKFVQTWSGDNTTAWSTIRYNQRMGLSFSLCGMYNIGHDVGGFAGPPPAEELLVRWVQACLFNPRFTIHSWNTDGTFTEPWMHSVASTDVIRSAIFLRCRMMPYLYSLLWKSCYMSFEPILRATFLDHEDDTRVWQQETCDEFMFGDFILVAPVMDKAAVTRRLYLPDNKGFGWWDLEGGSVLCSPEEGVTGGDGGIGGGGGGDGGCVRQKQCRWYAGGREVEVSAPLYRLPLFVKGGGILPCCLFDDVTLYNHHLSNSAGGPAAAGAAAVEHGGYDRTIFVFPVPADGHSDRRRRRNQTKSRDGGNVSTDAGVGSGDGGGGGGSGGDGGSGGSGGSDGSGGGGETSNDGTDMYCEGHSSSVGSSSSSSFSSSSLLYETEFILHEDDGSSFDYLTEAGHLRLHFKLTTTIRRITSQQHMQKSSSSGGENVLDADGLSSSDCGGGGGGESRNRESSYSCQLLCTHMSGHYKPQYDVLRIINTGLMGGDTNGPVAKCWNVSVTGVDRQVVPVVVKENGLIVVKIDELLHQ